MIPGNLKDLWFKQDALDAARLHARTFPDSSFRMTRVPDAYPSGREGDVLTVPGVIATSPAAHLPQ